MAEGYETGQVTAVPEQIDQELEPALRAFAEKCKEEWGKNGNR